MNINVLHYDTAQLSVSRVLQANKHSEREKNANNFAKHKLLEKDMLVRS